MTTKNTRKQIRDNKARQRRQSLKRRAKKRGRLRNWPPGVPEAVIRYMIDAGLVARLPQDVFWQLLVERFGDLAIVWGESAGENMLDEAAFSHAKNANVDLSLAVSSQGWGHLHAAYLSWFIRHTPRPLSSIIDVGCDNGVLTCAFARFHPEAKVVGIDICGRGVECAKQLAARLDLSNTEFLCADALNLPGHLANRTFDLVTSTSVAQHVGEGLNRRAGSVKKALSRPADSGLTRYARALSNLMSEQNSTLISLERVPRPANLAVWCRALHDAGINMRWDQAAFLAFSMWNDENSLAMPVSIGDKQAAELVKADELHQWWTESTPLKPCTPLEAKQMFA